MPPVERIVADDLAAGAGRGQRVLVVDARIRGPEHDLARRQLVERTSSTTRPAILSFSLKMRNALNGVHGSNAPVTAVKPAAATR